MLFKDKSFWKAYALTLAQAMSLILLSLILYLLYDRSMNHVYPFMQVLQNIQSSGNVTAYSNQFVSNLHLYHGFVIQLFALLFGAVILLLGLLSLFDYLILNQLKKHNFDAKEWLYEWFRYSSMGMLLLMLLHILLYNVTNSVYLLIALIITAFIYSYLIILMSFRINIWHSIKKTILRALILFIIYILFVFVLIVLVGLLKGFGALLGFLLVICMLVWSKIFLMEQL
jgi:hypothetical protein